MKQSIELKNLAQNISVIYVEDNVELRENMAMYLQKLFNDVRVGCNGKEGLALYEERPCDIIISDILMPVMNGVEMLKVIKQSNPSQRMIITSAYTESEFFLEAIKLGVTSYIIKPIDYTQMIDVLLSTVRSIAQERELELYHTRLEEMIASKIEAYKDLENARIEDYEKIVLGLVKMIEQRDSYTAGHSQRVATYSKMLAEHMGLESEACNMLYEAGILHDIGKIATPDAILLKPERLSTIEYTLIKEHVSAGVSILKDIPMFVPLIPIIQSHHERYDGQGYPKGLKADEIPLLARIMIVCDALDAMTTSRIYRHKKSLDEALGEIKALSGSQFDPEVAMHALEVFNDICITTEASQVPVSPLEEERFVYFYRDSVTDLYNQKYLSIVLLKNGYDFLYAYLFAFSLHHFTAYNHYMGWAAGDELLRSLASLLKKTYPDAILFRIHANDFIILSQDPFEDNLPLFENLHALMGTHLSYSIRFFNTKEDGLTTLQALEQRMNPSLDA